MPINKDFKRLVRARMRKTGEGYTAARAQLIKKTSVSAVASTDKTPAKDYAKIAGMKDAALKAKTGCSWERWVNALDKLGADTMSHREIASLVKTKYKVDSWWTQTVTVGYERIKGLRVRGQQRSGTFNATKSRTFNVPVTTLFDAWANETIRRQWMNGAKVKVRTASAPKSIRLASEDGGIIAVGFIAKGKGKSAVALEHTKLPSREAAEGFKQEWTERLDDLASALKRA